MQDQEIDVVVQERDRWCQAEVDRLAPLARAELKDVLLREYQRYRRMTT